MTTDPSPHARLAEAFTFLDRGNAASAEQAFQAILVSLPTLAEARFGLALARMSLHRESIPGDVLEQIAQAEHIAYPPALLDAGRMLTKFGAFALGARTLRKAQQLTPLDAGALSALSRCELGLGHAAAAEECARHAVALAPNDIEAHFRRARAFSRQHKWREACADYDVVHDANPAHPTAAAFLAEALYGADRHAEAEALARAVVTREPKNVIAISVLAKCLKAAGKYAEAEDVLLVLLRAPDFTAARECLYARRPNPHENGPEQTALVRAFWPELSDIARGQGWYPQALAEAANPVASTPEAHRPEVRSVPVRQHPDQPKITLITFSDGPKFRHGQEQVVQSGLTVGEIDEAVSWTAEDLRRTAFYRDHTALLSRRRGSGYWAWKPFLIYNELLRSADGDIIAYHDSGDSRYAFTRSVREVAAWCMRDRTGVVPCVSAPINGPIKVWTKRDCFHFMECDTAAYWDAPSVLAGYSFWRNSAFARDFVRQWMESCLDPRIVSDFPNVSGLPNDVDFLDHRHDLSVLANLTRKHGLAVPVYQSNNVNGLSTALR